jgi:hypothetical protein
MFPAAGDLLAITLAIAITIGSSSNVATSATHLHHIRQIVFVYSHILSV